MLASGVWIRFESFRASRSIQTGPHCDAHKDVASEGPCSRTDVKSFKTRVLRAARKLFEEPWFRGPLGPVCEHGLSFLGLQEFEIELEGSQTLRILCYEKCYNKMKIPKEDGENTDRIMGKGQVQVRLPPSSAPVCLSVCLLCPSCPQRIPVKLVFPAGASVPQGR